MSEIQILFFTLTEQNASIFQCYDQSINSLKSDILTDYTLIVFMSFSILILKIKKLDCYLFIILTSLLNLFKYIKINVILKVIKAVSH